MRKGGLLHVVWFDEWIFSTSCLLSKSLCDKSPHSKRLRGTVGTWDICGNESRKSDHCGIWTVSAAREQTCNQRRCSIQWTCDKGRTWETPTSDNDDKEHRLNASEYQNLVDTIHFDTEEEQPIRLSVYTNRKDLLWLTGYCMTKKIRRRLNQRRRRLTRYILGMYLECLCFKVRRIEPI